MADSSSTTTQRRWWEASKEEAHGAVLSTVRRIAKQNTKRRADDALFMRMYGQQDVVGRGEEPQASIKDALKFNVGRSVVNTASASISSKRPKPKFQTDDADWGLVRQAQACEQAVKGVFQANDYYALAGQVFIDGAVSSLGSIFVYGEGGRVKLERVFPGELLVDAREGYYGNPLTIYRVKLIDRQVVKERFGLPVAPTGGGQFDRELVKLFSWLTWDDTVDQVLVVEAWRLGAYDPKTGEHKPGKHIIACEGHTLKLEDWKRQRFPFSYYRWERRQAGFYGMGIVEELRPFQRSINYLNAKIGDMVHSNSRSNIVYWNDSAGKPTINVHHLDNDPTTVVEIKSPGAQPPQVVAKNAVPPELFALRREYIEDAYAQIGLSQMRATGQVPKGLDSGVAIREAEDVGSLRWSTKTQDWERLALDTAKLIVDELHDMAERDELQPIRVTVSKGSRSKVEQIDWKKVALKDDEYQLDLTPASSLPDSTAGRTQTVTDWHAAGFITTQEAKALLDHPDLERFRSLDLAAYDIVLDTIERIVEDGEYFPPEATDDIETAVKLVTQSYNKFRLRKMPTDRLMLLLRYLDDLKWFRDQAKRAAAPAAAVPTPAAAQATPAAAPQAPAMMPAAA